MRLPMPYRWTLVGLVLAGCSDDTGENDTTTGPIATAGSSGTTMAPADSSTTDPPLTGSTTTGICPEGTNNCVCLPDDSCVDDLECSNGVCTPPDDSTSTGDDTTTSGGPAVCGNGIADAGDLCLGMADALAMGAGTIALTIANVDSDPALDLVVANRDANTISIRLGDGLGDFGVQSAFAAGMGPIAVGHGDFNGDTNVDVVAVNLTSIDVTMLAGDGNGSFATAVTVPLGPMLIPTDLTVDDLEGDGDPDVLVTESTLSMIHVLRTDVGAFMPVSLYPVDMGPSAIHTADFSGEGSPDTVTANAMGNSVSLLLGNGLGQLGGASTSSAGTGPSDVSAGDFNGDGNTDAIVANPSGDVTIRLSNGLGGFGGQLNFPVPGGPVALVAADLDLDGNTDVAVVGGDSMVHVLLGNGAGTLVPAMDIAVGLQPQDIVAADLNEDGLLDLVTANVGAGGVSVILTNA